MDSFQLAAVQARANSSTNRSWATTAKLWKYLPSTSVHQGSLWWRA